VQVLQVLQVLRTWWPSSDLVPVWPRGLGWHQTPSCSRGSRAPGAPDTPRADARRVPQRSCAIL